MRRASGLRVDFSCNDTNIQFVDLCNGTFIFIFKIICSSEPIIQPINCNLGNLNKSHGVLFSPDSGHLARFDNCHTG